MKKLDINSPLDALMEGYYDNPPVIDAELVDKNAPEEETTPVSEQERLRLNAITAAFNAAPEHVRIRWMQKVLVPHSAGLLKALIDDFNNNHNS